MSTKICSKCKVSRNIENFKGERKNETKTCSKCRSYKKKYYRTHYDKIAEYIKKHTQEKRQYMKLFNEKRMIICSCGKKVRKDIMNNHLKKYHNLNNLNEKKTCNNIWTYIY